MLSVCELALRDARRRAENLAQAVRPTTPRDTDETAKTVWWEVLSGPLYQPIGRLLCDLRGGFRVGVAEGFKQAYQIHPGV